MHSSYLVYKGIIMNFLRKFYKIMTVFKLPFEVKPPYTHIVQIGDPVLRGKAQYVQKEDLPKMSMQKLMRVMLSIMENDKLAGISAPQVGVPLQVIAFQCTEDILLRVFTRKQIKENDIKTLYPQIFINPEMKILDYNTNIETEMCGSVLSLKADVKRYNAVSLVGWDALGKQRHMEATGFIARVIQHEMDHLNGVIFTDLMNPKTLSCTIWKEINHLNGYVELRYYPKGRDK